MLSYQKYNYYNRLNRFLYHRQENISLLPTLHVMFSQRATVLCFLAPARVGTRNVYQQVVAGNSRCLYKTRRGESSTICPPFEAQAKASMFLRPSKTHLITHNNMQLTNYNLSKNHRSCVLQWNAVIR